MDPDTTLRPPPVDATVASPLSERAAPFRADIAGLRAIAVLLVIGFHYAVPGFTSGFVGVDIFFVISGYLITQILTGRSAERRAWWAFYRSRVSRIYPPMVAVLGVLLALGYFYLEPAAYLRLSRHSLYSLAGVVNYRFYGEANYFAPERESNWLLHFWTLSVELQFYLIAPLLIWWANRRGRHGLTAVLLGFGGLSFAAGVYAGVKDASAAFYLTPFRLWEFFAGALAFHLRDAIPFGWRRAFAPAGLLLIAATLPLLSAAALPQTINDVAPVLGAALILAAGTNLRLLTNPVSRFIGSISYSIYLWHWPVWVAARHFGRAATALDVAALLAITLGLALVSRVAIERPFQRPTVARGSRWPAVLTAAATCAVAVAAARVVALAGVPKRVPALVADVFHEAPTRDRMRQDRCFLSPPDGSDKLADECFASAGDGEVMLFGDSHAAHLWPGFIDAEALRPFHLSQVTAGACPPLRLPMPATAPTKEPGAAQFNTTGIVVQCPSITGRAFDYIERIRPSVLVLSARWSYYDTHGTDVRGGLRQIVQQLAPLGVTVLIVGPIPEWTPALPQKALDATFRHGGTLPVRMHDASHAALGELDRRLAAMSQEVGAAYISLRELLCTDDGCLAQVTSRGTTALISWDIAHLTIPGSQWIVDRGVAPAVVKAARDASARAITRTTSSLTPPVGSGQLRR